MVKRLGVAGVSSLVVLLLFILAAVFGGYFTRDPAAMAVADRLVPPNGDYLLGTDLFGRDVFARILHGGRVSLTVAFVPVVLSLAIGAGMGLTSGYFGGIFAAIVMRVSDVILALPAIVLVLSISTIMGSGLRNLLVAILIVYIPIFARLMHGQTLVLRERDFVHAAHALGATTPRVLLLHVLPNALGPLIVQAAISMGQAVLVESALSFLGAGVPPPQPTWGGMLKDGYPYLERAPWLSIYPGLTIFIVVLAFSLIGDALRRAPGRRV